MEDTEGAPLYQLVEDAVDVAVRTEDPDAFLAWARSAAPARHPEFVEAMPEHGRDDAGRLIFWIARSLWDVLPLPGNGFRPRPLPRTRRNDPCPCGSGRKFKRCCAGLVQGMPAFTTEEVWPLVAHSLTDDQRRRAREVAPLAARVAIAAAELGEGHPGRARDLLLPLFEEHHKAGAQMLSDAVSLLTDAYEELGHDRPRREFLERVGLDGRWGMAAAKALSLLAADDLSRGEPEAALDWLGRAPRNAAAEPALATLELNALAEAGRFDDAAARAGYWRRHFAGRGDDELEAHLRRIELDPGAATLDSVLGEADPFLGALDELLSRADDGNIPEYALQRLEGPDDADEGGEPAVSHVLEPPASVEEAESAWYRDGPAPDPEDASGDERRNELIARYPAVLDSLDLLEDFAERAASFGQAGEARVERIQARQQRIAESILRKLPADARLPWGFLENRPFLRVLAGLAMDSEAHAPYEAVERYEQLLRLNPGDNQGVRMLLANLLLRLGRAEQALDLADRYPDDFSPELQYGRVLALYLLDRRHEAADALAAARERLPKVFNYLVAKKVRKPELDPFGVTLGGDDEAWLYRDAMRDTFAAVPGMLRWLEVRAGEG